MISKINRQFERFLKAAFAIFLSTCLLIVPFAGKVNAGKTTMTGDYANDTVTVAKTLKERIVLSDSDKDPSNSNDETVFLITDYISRYRNRSQINKRISFTTMQTALNALAGHYKTFPNRPVPENLKTRLNEELSKAEELVLEKT